MTPPILITDPDDPRVSDYRDVKERDLVGRRGLFVAEGAVVLRSLVTSAMFEPVSFLIAEPRAEALSPHPRTGGRGRRSIWRDRR